MLITIFLGPKFIEWLRVQEFGQQIREEGPQEHHAKAGTPTMGGLILFLAIAVPYLVLSEPRHGEPRGLRGRGRLRGARLRRRLHQDLQAALARALGALQAARPDRARARAVVGRLRAARARPGARVADLRRARSTSARCSTWSSPSWSSPGPRTRSTSPTGSTGSPPAPARSSCSPTWRSRSPTARPTSRCSPGCFVGASIGFLWFNAFPASIFMGDTGSLGLGGAIGAFAVMTQTELLLIILGGIFVIEALSVAVQVISFKLFRRRVLLMAPIHHHFELLAWSETKIMLRFWIVAAVCCGIGYVLYQNSIGSLPADRRPGSSGPADQVGEAGARARPRCPTRRRRAPSRTPRRRRRRGCGDPRPTSRTSARRSCPGPCRHGSRAPWPPLESESSSNTETPSWIGRALAAGDRARIADHGPVARRPPSRRRSR